MAAITMDDVDRDVLDHFKEGVGLHTIALRTGLERTAVQEITQQLAGGDRARAAQLVTDYDSGKIKRRKTTAPAGHPPVTEPDPQPEPVPDLTPDPEPEPVVPHDLSLSTESAPDQPEPPTEPELPDTYRLERDALAGPQELLPDTKTLNDSLYAAEQQFDSPALVAAAGRLRTALGDFRTEYDRESQRRSLRRLIAHHRAELDDVLTRYAAVQDTTPHGTATGRRTGSDAPALPEDITSDKTVRADIRAWAIANGHDIPDRGTVPARVVEAWWQATGAQMSSTAAA